MPTPARVLLVEDDEDHLVLTRMALGEVGLPDLEVAEVRNGQHALDYLRGAHPYEARELPNLVFLDLKLPGRNGIEVADAIKSDPMLSHIPIVMLTSSRRPQDIDAAYDAGVNGYVVKSFVDSFTGVVAYWTVLTTLPPIVPPKAR